MSNDVDTWFESYDNHQKPLMFRIRSFILAIDKQLTEEIKWRTPTFIYKGSIASFNPRSKKHVSLLFHTGAKIPGSFPSLHGGGETAGYMSFTDESDFDRQKSELADVVRAWIVWKDGSRG